MNVTMSADIVWKRVWHLLPEVFCLLDLEGKLGCNKSCVAHYIKVLEAAGWLERFQNPNEVYVHGRHKQYWKKRVEVAAVKPVPEPIEVRPVPEETKEVVQ